MLDMLWNIPSQPVMFQIVLLILLLLIAESAFRLKQLRWGIAGIVYITIGLWYFIDPIYLIWIIRINFVFIPLIIIIVILTSFK